MYIYFKVIKDNLLASLTQLILLFNFSTIFIQLFWDRLSQTTLKLIILLPQPPVCWDYRHMLPQFGTNTIFEEKKRQKKKRKFNLSRFFLLGKLSLLSLQSLVLSDFPHNLFGIIGMAYVITVDLLIECQGRQFLLTRGPPASLRSIQLDGKQMLIFVL